MLFVYQKSSSSQSLNLLLDQKIFTSISQMVGLTSPSFNLINERSQALVSSFFLFERYLHIDTIDTTVLYVGV